MKKLFLFIIPLLLFVWLQFEQSKGADTHNSDLMQLETRARAIQNYGYYEE